ncbi:transcription factor MBP1 [Sporobolomyces salmoneus]|uniref:transcription factor MBP1 n=1 Tax=Sporobolomyces salmoneus TaxID=183962 RepID=UPI00316DA26D
MATPAPAIYKACYSGVPVYEMPCQGVAVMRRKSDAWLNATQILKVAGFDKPQRTRVLEREVQKGTHEKVQGGYGKYQGTWVPMERGVALARQYGVDRLLQPIFEYVAGPDSPPLAPKHITAAPSRPRKKADIAAQFDGVPGAGGMQPPTAKAGRGAGGAAAKRKAAKAARKAFEHPDSDEDYPGDNKSVAGSSRGGYQPARSETPLGGGGGGGASASEQSETPSPYGDNDEYGGGGPTSKKRKTGHSASMDLQQQPQDYYAQAYQQQHLNDPTPLPAQQQFGLGPLRYARMILDYFVSEATTVPSFLLQPPGDFDPNVVIDDDGHTALHWACAMGRIRIVKLLLSAGADIFRANSMGQTALMRSVMFTNNYDLRKFPELFELLHRSTINIDRNDRTVFHYIIDIALQKGKTQASRYYIETVLARLVSFPEEVADILNFQDEEGETALTLAARARSKKLVKILLDNGADPKIANRDGKTAEDYILEDERFREQEIPTTGGIAEGQAISHEMVNGGSQMSNGGGGGALGGGGGALPFSNIQQLAGATVAGGSSSSTTAATDRAHQRNGIVPRLHTSATGQRISQQLVPAMSNLFETLASTYDAELADKDRELAQADALLSSLQSEINEQQRTIQQIETTSLASGTPEELEQKEEKLSQELETKMGKRFRLGWEKWVRDEDQREQQYDQEGGPSTSTQGPQADLDAYRELIDHTPNDSSDRAEALRMRIDGFKQERKELFKQFVARQSGAGTGKKLGQYLQLVSLGCGVPLDHVDGVIDALVEQLDQRQDTYA